VRTRRASRASRSGSEGNRGKRAKPLLASRRMFLRSLQIRGFKSFADRTTLEFAPGTSVIVGPNGSGKSNLVDAIAWVLGEQGPRALRGAQMADVIFAGSPGRPGLGMAEVHLVIDNSAGLIPVDASEIEVARVVYRSGESQYLIGGEPCRLLDIQELLSDTGIGRELHTVVGQGNLEDVLVARPEERRGFIEEAAGIAKHRRRKERAQRKLASLEQDLLRLQDVMSELKRQLRPLKQQADAAAKHEAYSTEAEELSLRVAAARLRALYSDREAGRPDWEEGQVRRRESEERMAELDARLGELSGRLGPAERAAESAEREEAEAVRARSAAEASLREAVRAEAEARARVASDEGRTGRLFVMEEDLRESERHLEGLATLMEQRTEELAQAEAAFSEAERARHEAEEERRHAREVAVSRRAELRSLRSSLEFSEAERARLLKGLEEVRGREAEAQRERDGLEAEIERLDSEETPQATRQERLAREDEVLAREVAELEDRHRALDARREALEARRHAVADSPGRRFLRRAGSRGIGRLGDLIEVKLGMEKAVAAALGPLADAVVYDDQARAVADAPEAAGATLAVAGTAPNDFVIPGERRLISVLRADRRIVGAVEAALRHTYLAADRNEALEKHRRHPGASFVTEDGVLVGPAVVRTAPTPSEDELKVRREEVAVERDFRRARRELDGLRTRLVEVRADRAEVEGSLRRADGLITSAADRMARVDGDLSALRRERELLEERMAGVERTVESSSVSLGEVPEEPERGEELPPVPEPPIDLRAVVVSLRRERRRLAQSVAGRRTDVERLRSRDPQRVAAELDEATTTRERLEAELRDTESRAADASTLREEAAGALAEVRAAEGEANRAWRQTAARLQELRDRYEDAEQARREVERRIDEAERVLREGHGSDPSEAVGSLSEDDTLEALQRRSDLVARRMALLGRVNLVAADEFKALQERHDFLKREIDDVRAARRDLNEVVGEVDRKIEEIFGAAYADVAGQFSSLFGELFPGGEGKLELTDPGDMLATGIEIVARPGRKRVKRLSLLSGGERALAALAFLFAIFRARPSPFYLLDEVEAALDDVNLHRFIELIKGFAATSQVLLVTHQKRTMEAADILYGVSMGRDGASSVIAQRVEEAVSQPARSG
jgi:chromosome segregation protein